MSDPVIREGQGAPIQRWREKHEAAEKSIPAEKREQLQQLTAAVKATVSHTEGAPPTKSVLQIRAKLQEVKTDPRIAQLMEKIGGEAQPVDPLTGRGTAPAA